ncbi:hypothetical protein Acor_44490 [Acrocarpospora corrugata]|uniref:histidine kinase n=1 Tax=Acrocarpospora corrugata TaxID=35763 RepID=A0A5M3W543_9ACTN|nr:HAMP domain-containing protein [Acrocarpospora corrugata]GES02383.1 hypothetical protein Acor_44490 [Acrocarpospora corrugata]
MGLRRRMAASYVLVTAAAVLVVEAALLGVYLPTIVGDSDLQNRLQAQAGRDAKILSLAVSDIGAAVPGTGLADLLDVAQKAAREDLSLNGSPTPQDQNLRITYTAGKAVDQPVEILVDPTGLVVAGSAQGSYPPGSRLDLGLPQEGGGSGKTRMGAVAWWSSPVLIYPPGLRGATARSAAPGSYKLAGYVVVAAPIGYGGATADYSLSLLTPGVLVLILVVPVGLVFGLLSTRRLIGRVRHLATITTAVAQGDFRPRAPVTEGDEIGQLEESFNRMTERLESALNAERAAGQAEARQAERVRIARELHDSISQDWVAMAAVAA